MAEVRQRNRKELMIEVSPDVLSGYVASINDLQTPEEEYEFADKILEQMYKDNPAMLEVVKNYIEMLESSTHEFDEEMSEEKRNVACTLTGFIKGVTLVYGMFLRHFQTQEFEENFG